MTERALPQVFLERQTYRRRRMMDAARLLPTCGAALLAVPLLWARGDGDAGQTGVAMSDAIIYVFAVWTGLILLSAGFAMQVRRWSGSEPPPSGPETGSNAGSGTGAG